MTSMKDIVMNMIHTFGCHQKRAVTLVENIRDAFVAKYPDKADTFKANSAAYIEKLNDLDKAYTDGLSNANKKASSLSMLLLVI